MSVVASAVLPVHPEAQQQEDQERNRHDGARSSSAHLVDPLATKGQSFVPPVKAKEGLRGNHHEHDRNGDHPSPERAGVVQAEADGGGDGEAEQRDRDKGKDEPVEAEDVVAGAAVVGQAWWVRCGSAALVQSRADQSADMGVVGKHVMRLH